MRGPCHRGLFEKCHSLVARGSIEVAIPLQKRIGQDILYDLLQKLTRVRLVVGQFRVTNGAERGRHSQSKRENSQPEQAKTSLRLPHRSTPMAARLRSPGGAVSARLLQHSRDLCCITWHHGMVR